MSIAEKLIQIAANEQKVYNAGYEKGKSEGGDTQAAYDQGYAEGYNEGVKPSYYIGKLSNIYSSVVFPENSEIELRIAKLTSTDASYALLKAQNLKKLTFVIESAPGDEISLYGFSRENADIEIIDLSNLNVKVTNIGYFAFGASKLKSIYGALDLSKCTTATAWLNGASALEDIEFVPNTIKMSIDFYWCTKLTKASITSIINGLSADTSELTVTLSKTAVNTAFTDEEWATLIATKPNWTISLS
jgi:hypothetical protein